MYSLSSSVGAERRGTSVGQSLPRRASEGLRGERPSGTRQPHRNRLSTRRSPLPTTWDGRAAVRSARGCEPVPCGRHGLLSLPYAPYRRFLPPAASASTAYELIIPCRLVGGAQNACSWRACYCWNKMSCESANTATPLPLRSVTCARKTATITVACRRLCEAQSREPSALCPGKHKTNPPRAALARSLRASACGCSPCAVPSVRMREKGLQLTGLQLPSTSGAHSDEQQARSRLERRYGRVRFLLRRIVSQLSGGPWPESLDLRSLFRVQVQCIDITEHTDTSYLPETLKDVIALDDYQVGR